MGLLLNRHRSIRDAGVSREVAEARAEEAKRQHDAAIQADASETPAVEPKSSGDNRVDALANAPMDAAGIEALEESALRKLASALKLPVSDRWPVPSIRKAVAKKLGLLDQ